MSERTLPDELRSVLLSHSFDAPTPDDTVARTLAETVETDRLASRFGRPWRRPKTGALVAAAVAGLVAVGGAGLVVATHHAGSGTSSSAAKANTVGGVNSEVLGNNDMATAHAISPEGINPSQGSSIFTVPSNLSCAGSPGVMTIINFNETVKLADRTDQIVSAQCSDDTGRRSVGQVYTARMIGGRTSVQATVLRETDDISVDTITGGTNQFTVRYLQLATADLPEALMEKTFGTQDDGASYSVTDTKTLARACTASVLTASVVAGLNDGSPVLRVINRSASPCELSGYPTIPGAVMTLGRGSYTGLVPIVLLRPGDTASAGFGPSKPTAPCSRTVGLPTITLPTGGRLTSVTQLITFGCPGSVTPFVSGDNG